MEPFYSVRTMPKRSGLWLATEAPRFAVKQSIDNKKMKIIRYSRLLEETWSLIAPLLPLPQLLDESMCITEVFFFFPLNIFPFGCMQREYNICPQESRVTLLNAVGCW